MATLKLQSPPAYPDTYELFDTRTRGLIEHTRDGNELHFDDALIEHAAVRVLRLTRPQRAEYERKKAPPRAGLNQGGASVRGV